jgi:hypothetical protein
VVRQAQDQQVPERGALPGVREGSCRGARTPRMWAI